MPCRSKNIQYFFATIFRTLRFVALCLYFLLFFLSCTDRHEELQVHIFFFFFERDIYKYRYFVSLLNDFRLNSLVNGMLLKACVVLLTLLLVLAENHFSAFYVQTFSLLLHVLFLFFLTLTSL